MQGGIFVSYRRDDAAASAGRLCDHLLRHFPREQVFFDVDNIEPGLDFVKVLDESVANCEVLLAVIGRTWISAKQEGRARLANPHDFVRIELESALRRDIRVVPVLVDGAAMPTERQLPEELRSLARRQAVTVSHASFASDVERLINVLRRHLEALAARQTEPSQAVPEGRRPIRLPEPDPASPQPTEAQSPDPPASASPREDEPAGEEPAAPAGPFTSALAEAGPEPGDAVSPRTVGQMLAEQAVAGAPFLLHTLDRAVAEEQAAKGSGASLPPATPGLPEASSAPRYSSANTWLAALIFPAALATFVGYLVLGIPSFIVSASSADSTAISGGVVATIVSVLLLGVVLAGWNRGARPEPTLFYASVGFAAAALAGFFLSLATMTPSGGPWPFFLLAMLLPLGYCIGLARGVFLRGRRGLLVYVAYFTPLALGLIPVWRDIMTGFDRTPPDAASYFAIGYLIAYFLPYLFLVAVPRPEAEPSFGRRSEPG
ncbi:MAG: TIR domain-containing protein [Rhizobiaceae bacterium]